MEDYERAFQERAIDTHALLNANRNVGAVHFGAITIECLLKTMIVERFSIDNWLKNNNGTVHGITNPGHELISALHTIPELRSRIPQNLLTYFEILQTPRLNYIDMRYDGEELDENEFDNWCEAYRRVRAWLIAQRPYLYKDRRRR